LEYLKTDSNVLIWNEFEKRINSLKRYLNYSPYPLHNDSDNILICFLIDFSGSMCYKIDNKSDRMDLVINQIENMIPNLKNEMEDEENSNLKIDICVYGFGLLEHGVYNPIEVNNAKQNLKKRSAA